MLRWLLAHLSAGLVRRHPLRAAVQVIAIAIGVALGYAVHLINASALDEFSGAVRHVLGQSDFSISAHRAGFDDALHARVAALPEVEVASPVIELEAPIIAPLPAGGRATLRVVGIDVFRAAWLTPALIGSPDGSAIGSPDGSAIGSPDGSGIGSPDGSGQRIDALLGGGLFLSPPALRRLGLATGDTLKLQVGARTEQFTIVGTLPGMADDELAVLDIAAAQARFDQVGRLHRIDIKLAAGTSTAAASRALSAMLPAGVELITPDQATQRVSNISLAYRVNLNVLALVALFTGAFLVFSLQMQAAVARQSELAFLRVIGVTAAELRRLLVAEAALIGAVGSLLGLALGAALAFAALSALGSDLGSGFFGGRQARLQIDAVPTLVFFALGVAAAIAGSWAPARAAARIAPALAMKQSDALDATRPQAHPWLPAGLLVAALGCALLPAVVGLPLFGYLSIALLLTGTILLQPRIAQALFAGIARLSAGTNHVPWLGATTRLARAPASAAIGLAGIVASFALMVAMATMVTSFRDSLDRWLDDVLPADIYVRAGSRGETGTTAHFSQHDLSTLADAPGVRRAEFSRSTRVLLGGAHEQPAAARAAVALLVRPLDADKPALPLIGAALSPVAGDAPPAWISEPMAQLHSVRVGDLLSVALAGTSHEFRVLGVWRDYARASGTIAIRDADYVRITGDTTRTDAALWLAPDARATDVIEALRPRLEASAVEFRQPGDIRSLSLAIFDRSFAVTYLLEVAAIVIGLIGIAATFSAQALARRREFGMLRHLGVTRAQILAQFALEGLLVTALGIGSGLVAGFAVALVLIHVVNPQSFHWTMSLSVPGALLAALMASLLATATLTAVLAARRAASGEAVRAVREDW